MGTTQRPPAVEVAPARSRRKVSATEDVFGDEDDTAAGGATGGANDAAQITGAGSGTFDARHHLMSVTQLDRHISTAYEMQLTDQWERSEQLYSKALELFAEVGDHYFHDNPMSVGLLPEQIFAAYFNRAVVRRELMRDREALEDCRNALNMKFSTITHKMMAQVHCLMANIHETKKRTKQAMEEYEEALMLDGQNPEIYILRAILHHKADAKMKAVEDCTSALSLIPSAADVHKDVRVFALVVRGDSYKFGYGLYQKDALNDYEKAMSLDEARASAFIGRGFTFEDKLGTGKKFVETFGTVLRIKPKTMAQYRVLPPPPLEQPPAPDPLPEPSPPKSSTANPQPSPPKSRPVPALSLKEIRKDNEESAQGEEPLPTSIWSARAYRRPWVEETPRVEKAPKKFVKHEPLKFENLEKARKYRRPWQESEPAMADSARPQFTTEPMEAKPFPPNVPSFLPPKRTDTALLTSLNPQTARAPVPSAAPKQQGPVQFSTMDKPEPVNRQLLRKKALEYAKHLPKPQPKSGLAAGGVEPTAESVASAAPHATARGRLQSIGASGPSRTLAPISARDAPHRSSHAAFAPQAGAAPRRRLGAGPSGAAVQAHSKPSLPPVNLPAPPKSEVPSHAALSRRQAPPHLQHSELRKHDHVHTGGEGEGGLDVSSILAHLTPMHSSRSFQPQVMSKRLEQLDKELLMMIEERILQALSKICQCSVPEAAMVRYQKEYQEVLRHHAHRVSLADSVPPTPQPPGHGASHHLQHPATPLSSKPKRSSEHGEAPGPPVLPAMPAPSPYALPVAPPSVTAELYRRNRYRNTDRHARRRKALLAQIPSDLSDWLLKMPQDHPGLELNFEAQTVKTILDVVFKRISHADVEEGNSEAGAGLERSASMLSSAAGDHQGVANNDPSHSVDSQSGSSPLSDRELVELEKVSNLSSDAQSTLSRVLTPSRMVRALRDHQKKMFSSPLNVQSMLQASPSPGSSPM